MADERTVEDFQNDAAIALLHSTIGRGTRGDVIKAIGNYCVARVLAEVGADAGRYTDLDGMQTALLHPLVRVTKNE